MKLTKKLLWVSIVMAFLISMTVMNVTLASPGTYFYVDPPYMQGTPEGKFQIGIKVADAPPSYAWEIHLSWDPERLELVSVSQGDFLHRWNVDPFTGEIIGPLYGTAFAYTFLNEANAKGEVLVTSTLVSALPMSDWASGNGWLMSFGFIAQAAGAAHLDLFSTRLWDHIEAGYPAPTYYPDVDGLVDATNFFFAGLAGWKLKVNGNAGSGLGLKTTVGTENLLEAFINNTGTFAAKVQAFFEIRDSHGYWLATIPTSIVLLPAAASTTLSRTWTATGAGVYYITAYSFYGELTPTIPDGFSRTLRLKAV